MQRPALGRAWQREHKALVYDLRRYNYDGRSRELAQNNGWSLSWQISASANFLGQELMGVADTTIAPVVNAVEHPVDTVEGLANAVEGGWPSF
jgi:hypothetical protein